MFNRLKEAVFPPAEKRSTLRTLIEIGIFYLVLAGIILVQPRLPIWFLVLLTLLMVLAVIESGRELLRVVLLAGVLVFGVIRPFVIEPFYIPSRSMENTLLVNDHIFVSKFSYWFDSPDRWEIIVFQYPKDRRFDYIKRVVGLPGDEIALEDHQVFINDQPVSRSLHHQEVEFSFLRPPYQVSTTRDPYTRNYRFRADGVQLNHQIELGDNPSQPLQGYIGLTNVVKEAGNHLVKERASDGQSGGTHRLSREFGPVDIPEVGEEVDLSELNARERTYFLTVMRLWFGDSVSLEGGRFFRGGEPIEQVTVREPLYFVMGDNRDHSEDSRVWGYVPHSLLQGRAWFIYYPFSRIGLVSNA